MKALVLRDCRLQRSRRRVSRLGLPRTQQFRKLIIPIDLGHHPLIQASDFVRHGSMAFFHRKKWREINSVNPLPRPNHAFDFLSSVSNQRAPFVRGLLVEHSKKRLPLSQPAASR
jgi:hypothetical protein